ncbi:MAG: methylmalonyl Co-A mutase-associated GTPase MeaB [Gaiellaceae bacterium]
MSRGRDWTTAELAAGVRSGEKRALGRALSVVENREPRAGELARELYAETGRAHIVGVTGPPGVGKSTLVAALVGHVRGLGRSVGVIAVDPSSRTSRGALLGDRIRLSQHFLDPDVYIRSLAARGELGGLAEATLQALLVLDASGKDVLFLETVGVGQSDVRVASVADTVVLALMPGSGDTIQALKAGIMEIPDVIAVTKSQHPDARTTVADLRRTLALGDQQPPVMAVESLQGTGVEELWREIEQHRARLEQGGELAERRRRNLRSEVVELAAARTRAELERVVAADVEIQRLLDAVGERRIDPLTAVAEMERRVLGSRAVASQPRG